MKFVPLGPLEQKVMDILWSSSVPLKPQGVLLQLTKEHNYAYTTIMTILKRLSDKKLANRNTVGKAYLYSPVVSKELFVDSNLSSIFNNLVDTYGNVAISNFVDVVKSNSKDALTLKRYLDKHK